jgi:hypothetical protein
MNLRRDGIIHAHAARCLIQQPLALFDSVWLRLSSGLVSRLLPHIAECPLAYQCYHIGATTFRLKMCGLTIFLDTWLERPNILPKYLDIEDVTEADYIFISHAHIDQ